MPHIQGLEISGGESGIPAHPWPHSIGQNASQGQAKFKGRETKGTTSSPQSAWNFPSFSTEHPMSPEPPVPGKPQGLVALGTDPPLDGRSSKVTLQSAGRGAGEEVCA